MNAAIRNITLGIGRGAWRAFSFILYVLLLVLGRVLLPIANLAIFVGTVMFLFCLVLRPDLALPMWAGAGLAVGAIAVSVLYEAALRAVAPPNTVVVSDV
ncbi:hypothetical protein [Massilia sp. X63]|jgi:hypothetical protein|uniref:hypothetical protein n=1 Tax=Massilia sp. X63 TaxID=3237285 RepID=UPI0034DD6D81